MTRIQGIRPTYHLTANDCRKLFRLEAMRWVNMHEIPKHDNKGQFVERVQDSVVSRAYGEPWCMDYVHFCVDHVNSIVNALSGVEWDLLLRSESCLNVLRHFADRGHTVLNNPHEGMVAIWDRGNGHGHAGVVVKVSESVFHTVEGNTGSPWGKDKPDGVYLKLRKRKPDFWVLKGFIDPWDGFICQIKNK